LTLLSPYVPLLFQGEEWASSSPFQYFVDFSEDPNLAQAVSAGRQRDFESFEFKGEVPDPQDCQTFLRSKLDWNELATSPHRDMRSWYEQLIALRRRHAKMSDGSLEEIVTWLDHDLKWLTIRRGDLWIVVNLATEPRHIPADRAADYEIVLASCSEPRIDPDGFHLPPEALLIAQHRSRIPNSISNQESPIQELTCQE
jgi:maltooligosyltrehalose trehalohydrolase